MTVSKLDHPHVIEWVCPIQPLRILELYSFINFTNANNCNNLSRRKMVRRTRRKKGTRWEFFDTSKYPDCTFVK